MHAIMTNICEGRGEEGDMELLSELAGFMTTASLCALGGTAGNPVLSTIRYFRNEYEAHIFDKKCRAGVCKNLFAYKIDEDICNGCTLCAVKNAVPVFVKIYLSTRLMRISATAAHSAP
jgi:hypothetical protein